MKERIQVGLAVLALVVLSAAALVACKVRPGCILAEKASKPIASKIVEKAACKNPEAIQQGVLKFFNDDLGLCRDTVQQTGMIADIVCPILGNFGKAALATKLKNSKLLQDGECDPNVAAESVADVVVTACRLLPF